MSLHLRFVGMEAKEQPPKVALYLLNASGQVIRKLAAAQNEKLEIDPALAKEGIAALGPDVDDLSTLERNTLMQFRPQERLPVWQKNNVIDIPADWWRRWLFNIVCVNGRVRKCFRFFLDPIRVFPKPFLPRPWPSICWPICNGVVEIYERTCCCRPPIIVDIRRIIDRLRVVVGPLRRWPWPPGPPNPPDPPYRIDIDPALDRTALREIKQAEAFGQINYMAPPNEQLLADFDALEKMQPAEAVKYVGERDYLWPIWCRCSTRKVGEAVLGPDGRFHFCYLKFPRPSIFCRTLYFYKVKQWQDTQFVTIYDGEAAHRYYTSADFADLTTFLGRACGQGDPPPLGAKPNVMLQNIGSTHSYNLTSHYMGKGAGDVDLTQTGVFSVAAPVANGGLVNANDAPWGEKLSFMLYFHPDLKNLGARFYRVSIVAADASGNPAGGATPAPLTNPVSWLKFVTVGTHFSVDSESLGPQTKTVGANLITGLYKIPYDSDAFWLGGQYHQSVDTRSYANGRYLIAVEIFDGAGNRLRPTGATGDGNDAAFEFDRWLEETGPNSIAVVPFAALTHLFWFDNRPCYADIVDLRKDHVANTQECQFMVGPAGTEFSVGFRAFHAASGDPMPPPQTFMSSFQLWYHRGLNGPTVTFQTGTTNQPATLLAGSPAESVPNVPTPPPPTPPLTFSNMLGPNHKCTFAVNLYVWAKHTNGSRQLSEYDSSDQAAFALELS